MESSELQDGVVAPDRELKPSFGLEEYWRTGGGLEGIRAAVGYATGNLCREGLLVAHRAKHKSCLPPHCSIQDAEHDRLGMGNTTSGASNV